LYLGDVDVLITDANGDTVYSGPLQSQSTLLHESVFPLSITVTPASLLLYNVYTETDITFSEAADLEIILEPVMNVVKYTINANNDLYVGTLTVSILDANSATVYSGPLATWDSVWPAPAFPLSMTVTPSDWYLAYSKTNIQDASNIVIALTDAPTTSAKYSVMIGTANPVAYTGAISVLITDVNGATIYSGPL
jgi:hypothetical protein